MSAPAPGVPVCYRHAGREANIRCQRCDRPICTDCMRDAAVGFQCPSCIAEGARSTRQAMSPYGGRRSADPALTSYVLIGINLVVWLAVVATGWRSSRLVELLGISPVGGCFVGEDTFARATSEQCGELYLPGFADGAYWQAVTSAFTHVELWHIAANMFSLYLLGPQVERVLGRARFLAVYAVSALTGSLAVLLIVRPGAVPGGASGAIFGLFGALAVISLKVGADLRPLGAMLLINLAIPFFVPRISWEAHIGGLLGGALVTAIVVYAPRGARRAMVQWLALFGVVALIALAAIARSAALA